MNILPKGKKKKDMNKPSKQKWLFGIEMVSIYIYSI